MAKPTPKKTPLKDTSSKDVAGAPSNVMGDDFTADLIKSLNKEAGEKIAYNLTIDEAPTNIKRWLHTGSYQLDYLIRNAAGGGYPEGRIIELQGPTSAGKSHVMYEAIKSVQRLGGIAVYIDTENATDIVNLANVGINVKDKFVFIQKTIIEEIFAVIESVILKARAMSKDVPVLVVWDSVAQSSPKAEIEGDYDQNTIGLAARVLGKGIRKIANLIGNNNVTLMLVNQQREKIGVMFGDPTTTPGGRAIPYACSLRLVLGEPRQLKKLINGTEQVYGVLVYCKTIKNKVARPWRKIEFEIHFGKGLVEDEQLMTELIQYCKKGGKPIAPDGCWVEFSEGGSWKYFKVTDPDGVLIHDVSFHREEFKEKIITQKQFWPYIRAAMDATFIIKPEEKDHASLSGYDPNSFLEAMAKEMEVTPQPEVL